MTTNNHPAHGPVSLDRLHQISEILSKAAEQSDGGNLGYAMADAVKVIDGVISAEPVGEVSEQRDGLVMDGTVDLGGTSTHRIIKGASKMKRFPIGTKFYITPPAPVVPGNKSITQHFDTIVLEVATEIMCDVNRRHEFLGGDVQLLSRIQCRIDEACRAAMLQAGNSPATPDTWIPVSERMPEEIGRYWCYVEEQNSLGKSHYQWNCSWNGEVWSDKALTGRVTHWMPLPSAPQR
ncbi:DUF551 domain-containing protein [Citrobacter freundii]|uniref:DUF551 domain-containing protein n=1 Tax=Citrobacter freundii TaxID=546 RepID=UPI002B27052D|nr:DUF551 domain-containing protein [Citrobacter freundii]MEA8858875.1 DUF551 domain-containing protein [Citrobacter freundii]